MMNPVAQELLEDFRFTTMLIHRYVDGVSDSDSVAQLPFEANCMNWLLGHIVSRRNSSLECLGRQPLWDESTQAIYRSGSEPIKDESQARPFHQLVQDLDATLAGLEAALGSATEAQLQKEVENDRGRKSAVDHLKGFHWHETFHLGQLELLRRYVDALS